jgi:hypothetical protein
MGYKSQPVVPQNWSLVRIFVTLVACLPATTGYAGSPSSDNPHFVVVMNDDAALCGGIADLYNQDLTRDEASGAHPTPDYETRDPAQFRQIGLRPIEGQQAANRRISYKVSLPDLGPVTFYRIHRWYFNESLPQLVILAEGLSPKQIDAALDALDSAQQPPPPTVFPYQGSTLLTQWPNFAEMVRRRQAGQNPFIIPEMNGPVRDALFQDSNGYVVISSQVYPLPERYDTRNIIRVFRLAGIPLTVHDLCYLTIVPSELLKITQEK